MHIKILAQIVFSILGADTRKYQIGNELTSTFVVMTTF